MWWSSNTFKLFPPLLSYLLAFSMNPQTWREYLTTRGRHDISLQIGRRAAPRFFFLKNSILFTKGSKIPLNYWHSPEMANIFPFRQYIYNVSYMKHCWIWAMFHCFKRSSHDNSFVSLIYSETITPFVSKCENDEVCLCVTSRNSEAFRILGGYVRQNYDYCNIT